jgi:hypothetical protein
VDGVSSVDILTLLLDTTPEAFTPEPVGDWSPRPAPSNWQLIRPMLWNLHSAEKSERTRLPAVWATWRMPWTGMLKLSGKMVTPRPDLFFNRKIGTQRTGRGLKVPIPAFKALKDRFGCTVNDAVLAVVSEGLYRWFKGRGERVPDKVRVFCPARRSTRGRSRPHRQPDQRHGAGTSDRRPRHRGEVGRINITTGDLSERARPWRRTLVGRPTGRPVAAGAAGRLMSTRGRAQTSA